MTSLIDADEAAPLQDSGVVLHEKEIRLLSALGFMAARTGQLIPCLRIFDAMALLRPAKAFPYIGMAIGYLAVGMSSTAVEILQDKASAACKDDPDIQFYLCLALQQAGQSAAAQDLLESWKDAVGEAASNNPLGRRLSTLVAGSALSGRLPVPAAVIGLD